MLVVAPASADLQISLCESLVHESRSTHELDRGRVAGLDVGLETVKPELREHPREHELQPLAHVTMAGVRGHRAVAEECALERAADDLADVDEADDRAVVAAAYEHRLIAVVLTRAEQPA